MSDLIYNGVNLARILSDWGRAPTRARIAARMAWRDKRLAALKAHKQSQPECTETLGILRTCRND